MRFVQIIRIFFRGNHSRIKPSYGQYTLNIGSVENGGVLPVETKADKTPVHSSILGAIAAR